MDKKCLRKKLDMNDIRQVQDMFGEQWDKFVSACIKGDEIWEYNDIQCLSGSAGYVILRGDTFISFFQTVIS